MNESSVDMTRMSPGESLAMAKRRERIQEGRDLLSKRSAELAKRRKRLEVKPWYILRPDAGVVAFRDMLSALALASLFFILPYEIAFVDAPDMPDSTAGLFIYNRIVDGLFLVEMLMEFFIAIPGGLQMEGLQGITHEDLQLEDVISRAQMSLFDLKAIAYRYATGWLAIDVAAMVPSSFDIYFSTIQVEVEVSDDDDGGEGGSAAVRATRAVKLIKLVRMARMLKMLRLVRLLKAFKMVKTLLRPDGPLMNLRDGIVMATIAHTRKLRIAGLLLKMLLICHIQACLLGVSAIFADEKVASWWGTHGYCWPEELYQLTPYDPFKSRCVDSWTQYTVCYTICLGMNFKIPWVPIVNTGPGIPHWVDSGSSAPFAPWERTFFVLVAFWGVLLGMYLTGTFLSVVSSRDGLSTAEQVTVFCKRYNMSVKAHREVQNYFLSLSELSGVVPRPDLFFRLSPTIANKIILDIHRVWINRLPFTAELRSEKSKFANGPLHRDQVDGIDGLLCKIALGMTPALFVPDDMSLVGRMHVIIKGVGLNLCTGQLLINGDSWGSSCLLLESAAQDVGVGHVRALSQVQSIKIDRKTFLRIIDDWPNLKPALMRLRIWALHRRLLAGIKRLAMITKHPKLFGWTHHTARLLKNTSRTQLASIPEQSSSAELLMGAEARIVERVAQMIDAKLEGVKTLLEQHALSASAPRLAPLEA